MCLEVYQITFVALLSGKSLANLIASGVGLSVPFVLWNDIWNTVYMYIGFSLNFPDSKKVTYCASLDEYVRNLGYHMRHKKKYLKISEFFGTKAGR